MGIRINFEDGFNDLRLWVKDVENSVLKQATKKAILRGSKTLQKETILAVRSRRALKVASIKARYTKVTKQLGGSNPFRYGANIWISHKSIPLMEFVTNKKTASSQKGRAPRRRVKVRFKVSPGKSRVSRTAFIIKTGSGKNQVVKRATKKSLPVKTQVVPGIARLFTDALLKKQIESKVGIQLQREFTSNLKFYVNRSIEKAKGKTGLG